MDRRGHDGRMDPTGSGQNLGNDDLSFPLIKKRSKFRRQPPKRFVDTERDIEISKFFIFLNFPVFWEISDFTSNQDNYLIDILFFIGIVMNCEMFMLHI